MQQQHNITTPANNATYSPTFNVAPVTPRSLNLTGNNSSYAQALVSPPLNTLGDWTVEAWFKDTNPAGYNHDFAYMVMKGDTNQSGEAPYMLGIAWNSLFAGTRTGFQSTTVMYNLTAAGVSICEMDCGMLHSKIVAIDDAWCMMGSANMDMRSFQVNFEVSMLSYDAAFAKTLRETVDDYCQQSTTWTVEEFAQRGLQDRLKEGTCRLFAPLI